MRIPAISAPRWMRLPCRTARLRLTILYGAAFLACGVAVLTGLSSPTCSTGARCRIFAPGVKSFASSAVFHFRVVRAPAADVHRGRPLRHQSTVPLEVPIADVQVAGRYDIFSARLSRAPGSFRGLSSPTPSWLSCRPMRRSGPLRPAAAAARLRHRAGGLRGRRHRDRLAPGRPGAAPAEHDHRRRPADLRQQPERAARPARTRRRAQGTPPTRSTTCSRGWRHPSKPSAGSPPARHTNCAPP